MPRAALSIAVTPRPRVSEKPVRAALVAPWEGEERMKR